MRKIISTVLGLILLFSCTGVKVEKSDKNSQKAREKRVTEYIEAVRSGDLDTIDRILAEGKVDKDSKGRHGRTPLMISVLYSRSKVFNHLLEKGLDPFETDN